MGCYVNYFEPKMIDNTPKKIVRTKPTTARGIDHLFAFSNLFTFSFLI